MSTNTPARVATDSNPIDLLQDLVNTIEALGGCTRTTNGYLAPLGDPDQSWTDLGHIYVQACRTLHEYGRRETPYPMVDASIDDHEWFETGT